VSFFPTSTYKSGKLENNKEKKIAKNTVKNKNKKNSKKID
jgi:hypothetical protein